MRTRVIGSLIALALSALLPTVARAQHGGFPGHSVRTGNVKGAGLAPSVARMQRGGFHGRSVPMGGGKVVGSGVHSRAHPLRPPFHGRGFRPFPSFGLGYPVALYPPFDYSDTPPYYPPSAAGIPVTNDPAPDVIHYADGRYELRGDGITRPYVWVWIPDAPPGPPASAADAGGTTSRQSSKAILPEPKIINIPAPDAPAATNDPTEPKIISVPLPDKRRSTKR